MGALRRLPAPVQLWVLYLAVILVYAAVRLPANRAGIELPALLLLALLGAALVIWRRRWAWGLFLILGVVDIASVAWEEIAPFHYALNVLSVALLLTPGMRHHVGLGPFGHRSRSSAA